MTTDVTTINDRFLLVIEQLGLSGYQVGKDGPVSAATISNIRNGSQRPNIDLVLWLLETYPQVSGEFILRGEGEPLGRAGTTIYNHQGTNNVYNYKSKTRTGSNLEQQAVIDGLRAQIKLQEELLDVYRATAIPQTVPATTDSGLRQA